MRIVIHQHNSIHWQSDNYNWSTSEFQIHINKIAGYLLFLVDLAQKPEDPLRDIGFLSDYFGSPPQINATLIRDNTSLFFSDHLSRNYLNLEFDCNIIAKEDTSFSVSFGLALLTREYGQRQTLAVGELEFSHLPVENSIITGYTTIARRSYFEEGTSEAEPYIHRIRFFNF